MKDKYDKCDTWTSGGVLGTLIVIAIACFISDTTSTPTPVGTMKGHKGAVFCIAFMADGKMLASGSSDQTVRIWDLVAKKEVQALKHTDSVYSIAIAPRSHSLVAGCYDRSIRIWDTRTWQEIRRIDTAFLSGVICVWISANEHLLGIAPGGSQKAGDVWDWPEHKVLTKLKGHTGGVRGIAITPNAKEILTCSNDKSIRIWEAASGKELAKLDEHVAPVECVTISPDGEFGASGDIDNAIVLWDLPARKKLATLQGHTDIVKSLSFSPDGKYLASVSGDVVARNGELKLWDVATRQVLIGIDAHKQAATCVAFSPSGEQLATGSVDQTIKLWNVKDLLRSRTK